jgi:murein L,D-transpeptidase YafK
MTGTILSALGRKSREVIRCLLPGLAGLLFMAVPAEASSVPTPAAQSWSAVLGSHDASPAFLIAVDKHAQKVFAYERHSPMRLVAAFPCTTGQETGDKLVHGDLKTPEGVYFVESHITSGLNYTLYGKEAYPLNYPNPVDRLRRKTGYGIWVHGKGVPLTPLDTQGCVGMNNQDIASLGGKIRRGQPVTIAERIEHMEELSAGRAADFAALEKLVHAWAEAWENRSPGLFEFYDAQAYSLAQKQSFEAFRAHKEQVFRAVSWIDNEISDLQILEGPGYWVTWFNQKYAASNLKTSGTRRLYWQKDAQGQLRIVGMEWLPGLASPVLLASSGTSGGLLAGGGEPAAESTEQAKRSGALPPASTAQASGTQRPALAEAAPEVPEERIRQFLADWKEAWFKADLGAYAGFYASGATQSGLGLQQMLAAKGKLWAQERPLEIVFDSIEITRTGPGIKVTIFQAYTGSKGYTDQGLKTLLLEAAEGSLLIVREDWKPSKK